jgi:hypothetical protein
VRHGNRRKGSEEDLLLLQSRRLYAAKIELAQSPDHRDRLDARNSRDLEGVT